MPSVKEFLKLIRSIKVNHFSCSLTKFYPTNVHCSPYSELSIKELYNTHKDTEDGLLYLMYSNLDPYWFILKINHIFNIIVLIENLDVSWSQIDSSLFFVSLGACTDSTWCYFHLIPVLHSSLTSTPQLILPSSTSSIWSHHIGISDPLKKYLNPIVRIKIYYFFNLLFQLITHILEFNLQTVILAISSH